MKAFGITLVLSVVLLGCEDFLDREPLDELSEATYFKIPADFATAANYFNTFLEYGYTETSYGDVSSDLSCNIGYGTDIVYGNGYTTIADNDDQWEDNYEQLRYMNQLISKAEEYQGEGDISESVAIAKFFRGFTYWKLLRRFGGVPIITEPLGIESEELYGPRNSRYEVVGQILSDLNAAIPDLPSISNFGSGDMGRVSSEAAHALKARVLLFEATYEKYADLSFLDGDGSSAGAGAAKPGGYLSINDMFTQAVAACEIVMANGSIQLWNKDSDIPDGPDIPGSHPHLFYLFCLEDGGGNPAGFTKADNMEFIWQTAFDFNYRKCGTYLSQFRATCPTRKLVDMYLCTDGLPVQHSAVFEGHGPDMRTEFASRDQRMDAFVSLPMKQYWGWGSPNSSTGGGAVYGGSFEENGVEGYDYRYFPNLRFESNGRNLGYEGNKFAGEHIARNSGDEASNWPLIRLAEVYLIFAEASCELGGGVPNGPSAGSISQGDLDRSINLIRARSKVAPLSDALIAPFGDLSMLSEIRRERAIELFGEEFRFDDLKRWGIAEDELRHNVCAVYIEDGGVPTEYTTAMYDKEDPPVPLYDPNGWSFGLTSAAEAVSTYAGIAQTKAGALIINSRANRQFATFNYLDPVPRSQIDINPALLQNPGW